VLVPLSAVHALGRAALALQGVHHRELVVGRHRVVLYEKRGQGSGPPALLVHGLGANANSFITLVRPMAQLCRRVMLLDLPGHGRAALRKGEPKVLVEELSAAVLAALDELGEPALLVGNSLGGALTLNALVQRPEAVLGWVGLSPAGAPLDEHDRGDLRRHFSGGDTRAARELQSRLWHKMPGAAWLVLRDFGRYWRIPEIQAMVAEVLSAQVELGLEKLRNKPKPALVLWGQSDRLLPWKSVDFFRGHLGEAAVEIVPRCGHLPQLERPRVVAARVKRFIEELKAQS
jgi:pimeloyl-ACP methyl ester carboxylesterase